MVQMNNHSLIFVLTNMFRDCLVLSKGFFSHIMINELRGQIFFKIFKEPIFRFLFKLVKN